MREVSRRRLLDRHDAGDRRGVPALRARHRARRPPPSVAPDAAAYPDADPTLLVPGSLVFQPTRGPVPLDDHTRWWAYVPGACWQRARGARQRHLHARASTRSPTSRSRTPRPTRRGRARCCRPRPSGSTRRAAGSTAPPSPGATRTTRGAPNRWVGEFPWQGYRGTLAGRLVRRQRLRALRHDRQRLGVDGRRVRARTTHALPRAARGRHPAPASSRAARTCARRATACATARRPARARRSTPPRATSASGA